MSLNAIKNKSFMYLFSKVFAAVINLLSIYLFTRLFKPKVYGDYLLFSSYVMFICSLIFWWHRLAVFRYYHKFKKNNNSYIKTSYFSFYALCLLLLLICFFLSIFPFSYFGRGTSIYFIDPKKLFKYL